MDIEQLAVDTVRVLAAEAVEQANSGHPGMPMGMADLAITLWTKFLTVDPDDPTWPDRDRFVLSNGHGSMLLYALLHLAGFPLPMEELRRFRQLGSRTPGHPERDLSVGIETTTGPLGQGFGNAVGMAVAESHLRGRFGAELVDHHTFAFVSDGDLMEGVAAEAASLAGHLGLGRLVFLYDDNHISIEGSTDLTFTEDVLRRFEAYGWHVDEVDGHDRRAVEEAVAAAIAIEDEPSLLACRTHIGFGAPTKQDTAGVHGSPLGSDELARTKELLGWDAPPFHVPPEVYEFFRLAMDRGRDAHFAWRGRRDAAFAADPALAAAWTAAAEPAPVTVSPPQLEVGSSVATRKASGGVIADLAGLRPDLIGGSADLAPSTNTLIPHTGDFSRSDPAGRNLRFGIREHAMGAMVNGINLHGGVRAFGATFLTFSDYMRPAVRMAALMGVPSIWVWTHDSVFLGEDGPTHQPVEHLASLRAIPGLWVVRPADAGETAEAWELAMNRTGGPTALVLTRQGVPVLDRPAGLVARGAYVLDEGSDAVLVATGSEVWVAREAARLLAERGRSIRVVTMPCVEAFLAEDDRYRREVLGVGLPIATLEAGSSLGWDRIACGGLIIAIDGFGESAPWKDLAAHYGFTAAQVADRLDAWLD